VSTLLASVLIVASRDPLRTAAFQAAVRREPTGLGKFFTCRWRTKAAAPRMGAVRAAAFPPSRRAKRSRRSEAELEAPLRRDSGEAAADLKGPWPREHASPNGKTAAAPALDVRRWMLGVRCFGVHGQGLIGWLPPHLYPLPRGGSTCFSAPTKHWPGARDLSRRNAGTVHPPQWQWLCHCYGGRADLQWETSRPRRQPTFLRTKVRAPFARPVIALTHLTHLDPAPPSPCPSRVHA
jgi:hypothetical protein